MIKMKRRSVLMASATTAAAAALPKLSNAQAVFTPPAYTPEDLKGQLTPFGAVKAANVDGSIPAWTGGGYPMPADYQQGDTRPIPFADEKPTMVITSQNMAQYADKLSPALQALFQKRPDFTMQIFPTHRTAIAPQWVYDNIYKNATNAQLSADGNSISGAYGGIPFPIPKNGHEVIWNHELAWAGTTAYYVADDHFITAEGEVVLESRAKAWFQAPYYFQNGEKDFIGITFESFGVPTAPPYQAGGSIMSLQTLNQGKQPVEAWEYLVGQRRVRRAPELQYDTPDSLTGGTSNWDEIALFYGQLNEYDFNYIGIKEMYVPYNSNKFSEASPDDQFKPHFINPDLIRWELHRCRIVEMTLKPGSRNVDARRTMYCDEDTGSAVLSDVYDGSGSLWKFAHMIPCIYGDVPACNIAQNFTIYDLHAGDYSITDHASAAIQPHWKVIPELPASFFTAGHLVTASGAF